VEVVEQVGQAGRLVLGDPVVDHVVDRADQALGGQRRERAPGVAGRGQARQQVGEGPHAGVARGDRRLPRAEHVDDAETGEEGLAGDVGQQRVEAPPRPVARAVAAGRRDPGDQGAAERLVELEVRVLLAGELLVEGAPRDARAGRDALDGAAGVPVARDALGEGHQDPLALMGGHELAREPVPAGGQLQGAGRRRPALAAGHGGGVVGHRAHMLARNRQFSSGLL
jgi:hypothetical protein